MKKPAANKEVVDEIEMEDKQGKINLDVKKRGNEEAA